MQANGEKQPMPFKIKCPKCGKSLTAPDALIGKSAPCPGCGTVISIPAPVQASGPILEPEPVPPPAPPSAPAEDEYGDIPLAGEGPSSHVPAMPSAPPPVPASSTEGGDQPRRPCPRCGEMIAVRAMKCRFCGAIFDPNLQKIEAAKNKSTAPGDDDLTTGEWVLALLCSGIGCIVGIVWMIQGKPKGKKMFLVALVAAIVWNVLRFMLGLAVGEGRP